MKQVNGVWLPDEEQEMTKFLLAETVDGFGAYQLHKLNEGLKYCKQFRVAVDVGAHCGLWAMRLVRKFAAVHCFEPVLAHIECLEKNAPTAKRYHCALGAKDGMVSLAKGIKSTGDTHIAPDGEYDARMVTLDTYDLKDVDFIKLDCEGYELFALQGGERMIDRFRPVVVVEQKPGKAIAYGLKDTEAVEWLKAKGYGLRAVIAGDYILSI
jgi:FkbM family methyltransferase